MSRNQLGAASCRDYFLSVSPQRADINHNVSLLILACSLSTINRWTEVLSHLCLLVTQYFYLLRATHWENIYNSVNEVNSGSDHVIDLTATAKKDALCTVQSDPSLQPSDYFYFIFPGVSINSFLVFYFGSLFLICSYILNSAVCSFAVLAAYIYQITLTCFFGSGLFSNTRTGVGKKFLHCCVLVWSVCFCCVWSECVFRCSRFSLIEAAVHAGYSSQVSPCWGIRCGSRAIRSHRSEPAEDEQVRGHYCFSCKHIIIIIGP